MILPAQTTYNRVTGTLTVENVYDRVGRERVARGTRIVAGMGAGSAFDVQCAVLVRQVGRDVHTSVDVVVDHSAVVVPEYVYRVHGALLDHAFQMQRAVQHQILLGSAGYLGLCLCKKKRKHRRIVMKTE